MVIKTTGRFDKDYESLPDEIKEAVDRKLTLFIENPRHPSLRVKKMEGTDDIYELRVSDNYRVTFLKKGDEIVLRKTGTHDILKRP